jgi:hypothetical protein
MNWFERKAIEIAIRRFLKGEIMASILAWLAGKKTYLTGIAAIVAAVLSLAHVEVPGVPEVDHSTAIQMIVTALMGIFIRNGVAGGSTK